MFGVMKLESLDYAIVRRCLRYSPFSPLRDPMFSRFGTIPACDTRTDRRKHDHSIYRASIASRDKNDL